MGAAAAPASIWGRMDLATIKLGLFVIGFLFLALTIGAVVSLFMQEPPRRRS